MTPRILSAMSEMGHGDLLLICDGNFPALRYGAEKIHTACGSVPKLLGAALRFFPLDCAAEYAACVMESCKGGASYGEYKRLVEANGGKLESVERFAFYDRAKPAAFIVVTADAARGGNILLQKGVVKDAEMPEA